MNEFDEKIEAAEKAHETALTTSRYFRWAINLCMGVLFASTIAGLTVPIFTRSIGFLWFTFGMLALTSAMTIFGLPYFSKRAKDATSIYAALVDDLLKADKR